MIPINHPFRTTQTAGTRQYRLLISGTPPTPLGTARRLPTSRPIRDEVPGVWNGAEKVQMLDCSDDACRATAGRPYRISPAAVPQAKLPTAAWIALSSGAGYTPNQMSSTVRAASTSPSGRENRRVAGSGEDGSSGAGRYIVMMIRR